MFPVMYPEAWTAEFEEFTAFSQLPQLAPPPLPVPCQRWIQPLLSLGPPVSALSYPSNSIVSEEVSNV